MTIKTRLIILAFFAIIFFIVTPYIVLYSLGYRVDFRHADILATGGIYIKAYPPEVTVTIDDKTKDTTGLFSSSFFVQNLLPASHHVAIAKDGYTDYQKDLLVQENQVTKLEHVTLFKKNILFEVAVKNTTTLPVEPSAIDAYIIKNNNLYFAPTTSAALPLVKNVLAYTVTNNTILYLATNGFLYQYDTTNNQTTAITKKAFLVNKKSTYNMVASSHVTILQEDSHAFLFNQDSGTFEPFYSPVTKSIISPDGQKILLYHDNQIIIFDKNQAPKATILNTLPQKITDAFWANNDYVIYHAGVDTMISETDIRGNINTISLPPILSLTDGTSIAVKNPKIYFNSQSKKLYILSAGTLLESEQLVP